MHIKLKEARECIEALLPLATSYAYGGQIDDDKTDPAACAVAFAKIKLAIEFLDSIKED